MSILSSVTTFIKRFRISRASSSSVTYCFFIFYFFLFLILIRNRHDETIHIKYLLSNSRVIGDLHAPVRCLHFDRRVVSGFSSSIFLTPNIKLSIT